MKITGYIFLFVLPLLLMACNTAEIDTAGAAPDSRIQLSYAVSRSGDTGYESSIEGIDVIAFDENNVCAYHEHFDIQSNGEKLLLGEKKTFFTPYVSYHVYLIANGSAALQKELDAFKTEGKKLADLRGVVQTTENIYLTGSGLEDAPTTFLMDGVARLAGTEYGTVVLNDGSVDNVQLDAVLSRAAAKVVVILTPDVSHTDYFYFQCLCIGSTTEGCQRIHCGWRRQCQPGFAFVHDQFPVGSDSRSQHQHRSCGPILCPVPGDL